MFKSWKKATLQYQLYKVGRSVLSKIRKKKRKKFVGKKTKERTCQNLKSKWGKKL